MYEKLFHHMIIIASSIDETTNQGIFLAVTSPKVKTGLFAKTFNFSPG